MKLRLLCIVALSASACNGEPEPSVCETAAVDYQLRCDRRLSVLSPQVCIALDIQRGLARQNAMTIALCEIAQPRGEASCYMESTCDDIREGACGAGELKDEDCLMACGLTANGCAMGPSGCNAPGGVLEECEQCALECERRFHECKDACPVSTSTST